MTVSIADMATRYPVIADFFGDWSRDVPWKVSGPYLVTTYSRVATDGKRQTAQARVRRDLFLSKFAEVDLAGLLRAADYVDRT